MRLADGAILGRYTIIEQIGRGGMATVYRGYDPGLARNVAIKVLPDTLSDDPRSRERFQKEAQAVARLRHPHIPTVFEFGEENGVRFIASELIDGGTLSDRLGKPVDIQETVRLLAPIASALDYAHRQGVLHRDVKPSNILLTGAGEPMLSDFGLARMMDSDERLTTSGTIIGTPEYMAPEQCSGEPPLPAGDIYSLAVVAYEMLTGRVPFSAETPAAVIMAQMLNPLPPPRSINSRLSVEVEQALLRGLAKEPAARYQTASQMVDAIASAAPADQPGPVAAESDDGWTPAAPRTPPSAPPPAASPPPPPATPPTAPPPAPPPGPVRTRAVDRQPPAMPVGPSSGGGGGSMNRLLLIGAVGVIAILVLAGLGWLLVARTAKPPPATSHATVAPTSPTPQVTPTPARPAQAQEAPLPEPRQEQAAAALGDKLYVMAGFDANRNDTDTSFVYAAGTWSRGPKLPIALDHASAAVLAGQLLIAGGNSQGKASAKVFALSPSGDAWNNAPSLHHARGALALISAGGKLYAIGGIDNAEVGPAEVLTPGAAAWTDLPPLPKPRDHVAGFPYKGMACVAGGRTPNVARVDCYDPGSNSWKQLPDLPAKTSGAGGASFRDGDEVVVAGGEPSGEAGPVIDQLARFVNGAWVVTDKMMAPRHGLQLALASDGRIWACGGATQPGYAAVPTCTSIGPITAAPKA